MTEGETRVEKQANMLAEGRKSRWFMWGMTSLVVLVFVAVAALVYYAGLGSPTAHNQKPKVATSSAAGTLPQASAVQGITTQGQATDAPGAVTVVGPDATGIPTPAAVPSPSDAGSASNAASQLQGSSAGAVGGVSQTVQNTVQTVCGVTSLLTSNCPIQP